MSDEYGVKAYVDSLLECPRLGPQICAHKIFDAVAAEYGENRRPWSRAIANLLEARDVRLYSHQTLATDYLRAGSSVAVATPTASGKSLVYNLPVLENWLKDNDARALYLFPLKALAQDQLAAFRALTCGWPRDARPEAALYDGDTGDYGRRKIRANPPAVLLTNPEMLHLSLLPYHEKWATFLANLNYVIVDEAHVYRGVFGANVAWVFRRLNRIAARYGAKPSYVFCTATLGNPAALASALAGEEVALVNKSGAPRGKRRFLFVNPELSPATCAIDLMKRALERDLRVIVYCKTRRLTELISSWAVSGDAPCKDKISAYRAGFLPEERREIEARLANGELRAVVGTNALELGIDIGGLDVCILVGYPGTVMQTLQRAGRVGRSQRESAVIMVAGEDALDQYFARNPDDFFNRKPEKATLNPDNEVIVARHLECAAAEIPLETSDPALSAPGAQKALAALLDSGALLRSEDRLRALSPRKYPQRLIDLRGGGAVYDIVDERDALIGSVESFRVWRETHPGAVYLHKGKSFLVESVDDGRRVVRAKAAAAPWFTRVRANKRTDILKEDDRASFGSLAIFRGRLRVTETITGYEKRSLSANRLISVTPLDAPPQIFETDGLWIVVPDEIRKKLEADFIHFMGSIHALEHAVIGVLPLEVMADRNDFGGVSIPLHPQLGLAAVFVYDSLPGGAGLAASCWQNSPELLALTARVIANCPCEEGCPSCIQSPKCGAGNRPLSKFGVSRLLAELLAPGDAGDKIRDGLVISPPPEAPKKSGPAPRHPLKKSELRAPAPPRYPEPKPSEPPPGYVVFDIETRRSAAEVGGWENAGAMGVSVAVLYDSALDSWFTYEQDELEAMFAKMAAASLVVGFNSLRFDYLALEPFAAKIPGFNLRSLPSLDIMQRVRERSNCYVSLDNLAHATLGEAKSADGLKALRWWKEGKIAEITAYCKKDVKLTRDLYLFGLRENYLLFGNKRQEKIRVVADFRSDAERRRLAL